MGSWHWEAVCLGFFPKTLYSRRWVEISTHQKVNNKEGQCLTKGALLLRSWETCFLSHNCLLIPGMHCPHSFSGQKVLFSQLLDVLSADCRVPFQEMASPGHPTTNIWFMEGRGRSEGSAPSLPPTWLQLKTPLNGPSCRGPCRVCWRAGWDFFADQLLPLLHLPSSCGCCSQGHALMDLHLNVHLRIYSPG